MINVGSSVIERECRNCGASINFTLSMLLKKAKFNCSNCNSVISLNKDSYDFGLEIPEEVRKKIKFKDFSTRLN